MTGLVVLGLAGVALLVLALATAERPVHGIPDRDGYFDQWSQLHGGYEPRTASVWVRFWLTLVYRIARPLARRGVQPDVVTISSLWFALAVFLPASQGGYWPILAGWLLAASGLFDTLDGCVAVLEKRTTRWGYVLDSLVDRVNDVVYLAAVVSVGAPVELAVVCGTGFFLLEYARARAGNAGGDEVGRVTVGERPMRVIFLSASIHFGGVLVAHAETVATAGLSVMTVFTAVGLAQLLPVLRRQLLAVPVEDSGPVPLAPPPTS